MKANYHTHSCFCDGNDSPEELVKTALEKNFSALGFSSHSFFEPDADFAMSSKDATEYRRIINELKEKYKDKIDVFCGIEQDYYSAEPTAEYDYIIGSVHYVKKSGEFIPVDESPEKIKEGIDRLYGGSFDALAEDFFKNASDVVEKTGADIIGHFDIVSKYSEINGYKQSPEFLTSAEKAIIKLVKYEKPFEINTGAMAKGYKSVPYPSPEILRIINNHGGKIMISSDCHDKKYLDFAFDYAEKLALQSGFTEKAIITGNGIKYVKI